MAGTLVSIGGVTVDYRRPSLRFTSQPNSHVVRGASISGLIGQDEGDELSERAATPSLQRTVMGFTGIQEYVIFDGVLASKTGYYIISNFETSIDRELLFGGFVEFSLTGGFLGDVA